MNRIAQLEEFYKEDPGDPFNAYALALEFLKLDPKKAYELFDSLLKHHPEYLPTYYPFANLLVERQQNEKAEAVFKQGIETSKRRNDLKTFRELNAAYNDWLFERS